MLKKIVLAICAFVMSAGLAFAQADVNKSDQAALDGIKGIGPAMSKRILDERKKGNFKDWADFQMRVKGVGDKSANKLSDAGLTVNGQPRSKSLTTSKGEAKGAKKTKGQDGQAEKSDKPAAGKG